MNDDEIATARVKLATAEAERNAYLVGVKITEVGVAVFVAALRALQHDVDEAEAELAHLLASAVIADEVAKSDTICPRIVDEDSICPMSPDAAGARRPFWTPRRLAEYLGVHERTLRTWLKDGKIASHSFEGSRRIAADDVDAYIAATRTQGFTGTSNRSER